ncbi:uncharacterized protein [Musca autumnalis]|uniref:uncharacterized protein n=1 Tax=Musca autumnalis TaxID=221902 RepID=UPI003CF619B1
MDKYCRLCAQVGIDHQCLYSLDGHPNQTYKLVEKYFLPAFFQVKWSKSFNYICRQCWSHVMSFDNFQDMVWKAQRTLIEIDAAGENAYNTRNMYQYDGATNSNREPPPHTFIKSEIIDEPPYHTENQTHSYNRQGNHNDEIPLVHNIKQELPEGSKENEMATNSTNQPFNNHHANNASFYPGSTNSPNTHKTNADIYGNRPQNSNTARHPNNQHQSSKDTLDQSQGDEYDILEPNISIEEYCDTKISNNAAEYDKNLESNSNSSDHRHYSNQNSNTEYDHSPTYGILRKQLSKNANENNWQIEDSPSKDQKPLASGKRKKFSHKISLKRYHTDPTDANDSGNMWKVESSQESIYPDDDEIFDFDISDGEMNSDDDSMNDMSQPYPNDKPAQWQPRTAKKNTVKPLQTREEYDNLIAQWRPNLECRICQATCDRLDKLQQHFAEQHPNDVCFIECCQIQLYYRYEIQEHIYYHQQPAGAHTCNICCKSFTNVGNMKKHILEKHSDTPAPMKNDKIKCEKCEKVFSKVNYDVHKNFCQGNIKRFPCDECSHTFLNPRSLGKHKYRYHSGKFASVQCQVCDRILNNKYVLEQHMLQHSDECKNSCTWCPKSFRQRSQLIQHCKRSHTEVYKGYLLMQKELRNIKQPVKCEVCDKIYQSRSSYMQHKRNSLCGKQGRVMKQEACAQLGSETALQNQAMEWKANLSPQQKIEMYHQQLHGTLPHQQALPQESHSHPATTTETTTIPTQAMSQERYHQPATTETTAPNQTMPQERYPNPATTTETTIPTQVMPQERYPHPGIEATRPNQAIPQERYSYPATTTTYTTIPTQVMSHERYTHPATTTETTMPQERYQPHGTTLPPQGMTHVSYPHPVPQTTLPPHSIEWNSTSRLHERMESYSHHTSETATIPPQSIEWKSSPNSQAE